MICEMTGTISSCSSDTLRMRPESTTKAVLSISRKATSALITTRTLHDVFVLLAVCSEHLEQVRQQVVHVRCHMFLGDSENRKPMQIQCQRDDQTKPYAAVPVADLTVKILSKVLAA